eukprot:m.82343 g.82343  ORF g.82343 m.82343 type:complete len:127 (+) comp8260_c0_seq2:4277-4657(+)
MFWCLRYWTPHGPPSGALDYEFVDSEARDYTFDTLEKVLAVKLIENEIDAVAELLVCYSQLGFVTPLARAARYVIIDAQNDDGSIGNYSSTILPLPGYDTVIGGTLHTTMVSTWALVSPDRANARK